MVNPILDGISLLLIHCPSYTDRLVNGYIPLYTTLNLCKLAEPLFAHIVVSENDESPKPSKPWVSILKWSNSGIFGWFGGNHHFRKPPYVFWVNKPRCLQGWPSIPVCSGRLHGFPDFIICQRPAHKVIYRQLQPKHSKFMDEKWWSLTANNAKLKMDGTFKHL